jgi:hypothetical protein
VTSDGFGWAVPVLVPDLVHELLPADSGSGVGSESSKQIELLGPQRQVIAVHLAASRREIDSERS